MAVFRVEGPLNFTLVGILSKITGVLAERQIRCCLSTFDTDYLLVRTDHLCQESVGIGGIYLCLTGCFSYVTSIFYISTKVV